MAGVVLREQEDRDAAAIVALRRECDDSSVVSEAGWVHYRRHQNPRERALGLVAEVDGTLVGMGNAGLNITTTTPGAAWAQLRVTAPHRRRGIGSQLHEALLVHLAEIGATRATSFMRWTEEGERWASARGWKRLLTGPLIALELADVPEPSLPPGFTCVSMADFGQPEAIFELTRLAILDEPRPEAIDDLRYEDWINEWEDPDLDRPSSAVVLHGDRPVTFAYINLAGDLAAHGGTGTHPDYRGRGLATAAKRFALRALAARGVKRITTSNAEENAPMRAINRRLGFEPIGEHVILGRDL
jgi:RimJ/RimL family protein N-acetyltransferase